MLKIHSPKGLSPVGVAPRFVTALLPFLAAAIAATVLWPEVTRFPGRPNAPVVLGGLLWLALGVPFWALTVRRFLRGFRRGELITDGTFGYCRNPLYASMVLFLLPAIALIAETWTFLVVALIAAALALRLVRSEESDLARLFGAEWEAYSARIGPLVPIPSAGWPRGVGIAFWAVAAGLFLYVGALRPWLVR